MKVMQETQRVKVVRDIDVAENENETESAQQMIAVRGYIFSYVDSFHLKRFA